MSGVGHSTAVMGPTPEVCLRPEEAWSAGKQLAPMEGGGGEEGLICDPGHRSHDASSLLQDKHPLLDSFAHPELCTSMCLRLVDLPSPL